VRVHARPAVSAPFAQPFADQVHLGQLLPDTAGLVFIATRRGARITVEIPGRPSTVAPFR
jgi:hypothetical protein